MTRRKPEEEQEYSLISRVKKAQRRRIRKMRRQMRRVKLWQLRWASVEAESHGERQ